MSRFLPNSAISVEDIVEAHGFDIINDNTKIYTGRVGSAVIAEFPFDNPWDLYPLYNRYLIRVEYDDDDIPVRIIVDNTSPYEQSVENGHPNEALKKIDDELAEFIYINTPPAPDAIPCPAGCYDCDGFSGCSFPEPDQETTPRRKRHSSEYTERMQRSTDTRKESKYGD